MNITFINPVRADINAHLTLLKPAFAGIELAKEEYQFCCDAVRNKQAGLYQIKGRGVDARFVGIVTQDNEYLILALAGRGLVAAAQPIIEAVSGQRYRAIKFHTIKSGMTRILRRFGFVISTVTNDTVLTLDLEGC
ncbi:MAG: hypothetical protein ACI935_002116 [Moritella dasanensis]|jgi:hypothetical protein